MRFQF